ncbi:efflux RND transporter permease subunit [Polynucleobacter necessarius]|uniref:efflux RND transporter permease subunit n=1 Tax=Polynucleobacter necessarius TaxID=576610 RepID=UPI0022B256DE|nr:efflux RND transporter permease subunit [Polynucleobacter necessarius]
MEDALLHGCGHRFRPVMMTASVAMLALVPMLFSGAAPDPRLLRPLAAVVIAGLVTSTALALLVLPVLYRWFEEKEVEA